MNIAVAHPGKIGDLLFCLPTARDLCERHGVPVDVYTSPYCRDALGVIAAQPYVRRAAVLEQYVMDHFDMGAQPWRMPVPEEAYDHVYQLGFRSFPDRHCIRFVAHQAGLPEPDPDDFALEIPGTGAVARRGLRTPYVVLTTLSSTGGGSLTWPWSNPKVSAFVRDSPLPVYVVGLEAEWARYDCAADFEPLPGLTLLEIAEVMRGAVAVITYSTGLGVLASGALRGTGVSLVCLFDGEVSWDVFGLPGALTCSPDEDLGRIALGDRSREELAASVAALGRVARSLSRELAASQAELSRHRTEAGRLARESRELHASLHERNLEVERLRRQEAEAGRALDVRNREFDALLERVNEMERTLHARDVDLVELTGELEEARRRLAALEDWRRSRPGERLRRLFGLPGSPVD